MPTKRELELQRYQRLERIEQKLDLLCEKLGVEIERKSSKSVKEDVELQSPISEGTGEGVSSD